MSAMSSAVGGPSLCHFHLGTRLKWGVEREEKEKHKVYSLSSGFLEPEELVLTQVDISVHNTPFLRIRSVRACS